MKYRLFILLILTQLGIADAEIEKGSCQLGDNQWLLTLKTRIVLEANPIEAIKSGIPLYFRYQIEARAPKWFSKPQTFNILRRLSYNHLTFSYRITDEQDQKLSYQNLEDALAELGTLKDFHFSGTSSNHIRARFSLATDRLPFSLRLSALLSDSWHINSGWWLCPQIPSK
ncbi:DUF4390 domain-containing protein [Suttonella ornithocola]|uniref:DUF4390 domain-containing protein n=1 Tax=Suttonella ornithocola TaxID=279832 RepID=A0A380MRM8_9GAMM|nr:DUF4390 domain-containing protein [Suttonella ornithocola]SUO94563.1 Uncharacterised protein [Suttonella ornithocola]